MQNYQSNYYAQNGIRATQGKNQAPTNNSPVWTKWDEFVTFGGIAATLLFIAILVIMGVVGIVKFAIATFDIELPSFNHSISDRNTLNDIDDWDVVKTFVDENKWNDLTYDEKVEMCESMIKIEADSLDLPNYKIKFTPIEGLTDEQMAGYYQDFTKTIAIDQDILAQRDGQYILNIVCHECRHSKQHRMADSYINKQLFKRKGVEYEQSKIFYENFLDYKALQDDYDAYYNQPVEVDARAYAESQVNYYVSIFK